MVYGTSLTRSTAGELPLTIGTGLVGQASAAREDRPVAEGLASLQEVSARDHLSLLDVADTVLQPSHAVEVRNS